MLASAIRLVLVTAAFTAFTTTAHAQKQKMQIHPRCAKVEDKVRCTCLFEAGGVAEYGPSGQGPRVAIYTAGQGDVFVACMKRNGRA
jgi:hypothetical protein